MVNQIRAAHAIATALYGISGAVSIAAALMFTAKFSTDKLTALLLSPAHLEILVASGVLTLFSAAAGLFALSNTIARRRTLQVYGLSILVVVVLQLIVACVLWLETLTLRAFIEKFWLVALTPVDVGNLQEKLSCCGFANATDRAVVTPKCPADGAATSRVKGCKDPVVSSSQLVLENFYTAIFAAIFIDVFAFLGCAILAQYRQEEERFKKIDAKHLAGASKLRI